MRSGEYAAQFYGVLCPRIPDLAAWMVAYKERVLQKFVKSKTCGSYAFQEQSRIILYSSVIP